MHTLNFTRVLAAAALAAAGSVAYAAPAASVPAASAPAAGSAPAGAAPQVTAQASGSLSLSARSHWTVLSRDGKPASRLSTGK